MAAIFRITEVEGKQNQQIIKQTDKEIDAMVYELYGLSEEEIAVVEGN